MGLQMGKFRQIITELWPLIGVKNSFSLAILSIFLTDFHETLYESWCLEGVFGIEDG